MSDTDELVAACALSLNISIHQAGGVPLGEAQLRGMSGWDLLMLLAPNRVAFRHFPEPSEGGAPRTTSERLRAERLLERRQRLLEHRLEACRHEGLTCSPGEHYPGARLERLRDDGGNDWLRCRECGSLRKLSEAEWRRPDIWG